MVNKQPGGWGGSIKALPGPGEACPSFPSSVCEKSVPIEDQGPDHVSLGGMCPQLLRGEQPGGEVPGGSARGAGQGARGLIGVGLGVSSLQGDTSYQPQQHVCPLSVGNLEVTNLQIR